MKNDEWGDWTWYDETGDSSPKDNNGLTGNGSWTQGAGGENSWGSSFDGRDYNSSGKDIQGYYDFGPANTFSHRRNKRKRTAAILTVILLLFSIIFVIFVLFRTLPGHKTTDVEETAVQDSDSDVSLPDEGERENQSAAEQAEPADQAEQEEVLPESDSGASESDRTGAGENQIAGVDFYESAEQGYYYRFLDEKERTAYDALSTACQSLESTVQVDLDSAAQEKHAVDAFRYDHPQYYWLARGVSYYYYDSGQVYQILMDIPNDAEAILDQIYEIADSVIARIPGGSSATDYDKIKWFYEYLISAIEYGYDADDNGQTPKGALIEHISVCAGYSTAFKLLCDQAGVECITLTGDALILTESRKEPHAWNMVLLDGNAYWVDVTWADPLFADDSMAMEDWTDYNYLCATDEDFLPEHHIDLTLGEGEDLSDSIRVEYPACTHEQYCYYYLQDQHFGSVQEAEDYIRQCIIDGQTRISFKYDYKEDYLEGMQKLFEQSEFWNIVDEAGKYYSSMTYRKNDYYRTIMIELE